MELQLIQESLVLRWSGKQNKWQVHQPPRSAGKLLPRKSSVVEHRFRIQKVPGSIPKFLTEVGKQYVPVFPGLLQCMWWELESNSSHKFPIPDLECLGKANNALCSGSERYGYSELNNNSPMYSQQCPFIVQKGTLRPEMESPYPKSLDKIPSLPEAFFSWEFSPLPLWTAYVFHCQIKLLKMGFFFAQLKPHKFGESQINRHVRSFGKVSDNYSNFHSFAGEMERELFFLKVHSSLVNWGASVFPWKYWREDSPHVNQRMHLDLAHFLQLPLLNTGLL